MHLNVISVEGQGIGKNADGIVKPVKANLKFDTAGLCFDKAQEFTDHWWEKAFNTAAGNLSVDGSCGNVSISIKNNESIEVRILSKLFRLHFNSVVKEHENS